MPDRELRAPEEQRSDLRGETRTNAAAAGLPRPVRILRRLFGQYRTMRCTVRRIQAVRFSVAAPSPGTSRCDPRLRGIQSQGLVFKIQRSEQQSTSLRENIRYWPPPLCHLSVLSFVASGRVSVTHINTYTTCCFSNHHMKLACSAQWHLRGGLRASLTCLGGGCRPRALPRRAAGNSHARHLGPRPQKQQAEAPCRRHLAQHQKRARGDQD